MRWITPLIAAVMLTGCAEVFDDGGFVDTIAPHTAQGVRTGGIIGGLAGASGVIVAKCVTLDGEEVSVTVDGFADAVGAGSAVEAVREKRQGLCDKVGAVDPHLQALADPETAPVAPVKP